MFHRILIVAVICLAPFLVYCLILIGLNSRRRASLIPGSWDFAGVLLACSGFILGGGPLVLAGLNAACRWWVLRGRPTDWFHMIDDANVRLAWVVYFLMVIIGSTLLIWRRRNYTVIYNVDTDHFWSAFEWTLGRLAIIWQRIDNRYELHRPLRPIALWRPKEAGLSGETPVGSAEAKVTSEAVKVAVHVLPSNRNVTLHWLTADPEMRGQVEAELSRMLPTCEPRKTRL